MRLPAGWFATAVYSACFGAWEYYRSADLTLPVAAAAAYAACGAFGRWLYLKYRPKAAIGSIAFLLAIFLSGLLRDHVMGTQTLGDNVITVIVVGFSFLWAPLRYPDRDPDNQLK